jgi:hypothetical protein
MSLKYVSSGTVANYFSIIRKFLRNNGVSDSITFSYHSKQMLRATKVFMRRIPIQAPPLSVSLVRSFINISHKLWPLKAQWFTLALKFAFFGFFRLSNLAPLSVATFDPTRDICRQDIFVFADHLQILIKWSKTDQDMSHTWISRLYKVSDKFLCPVSAYLAHCADSPTTLQNQHFIVKKQGKASVPVTQFDLTTCFSECTTALGLPKNYTWHSVRRGAVHAAAHSGASKEQVKNWGGWRSDAVLTYYPQF